MKKILLIEFFLVCLFPAGYSQDKIITLNKDTIDCKISKVSQNAIHFDISTQGVISSGKLPRTSVLSYTISEITVPVKQRTVNASLYDRLRIGMNGGFGYLLASSEKAENSMISMGLTTDQAHSYYKNLKSGMFAGADLTYLFSPSYGAGIKYKFFDTSSSLEGFFDPQDGVNLIYCTYKEQIYVNFIGAEFFYQQLIENQESLRFNSAFSIGLATYRNEAEYLNGYYLLTGKNFGADISVGIEYFIKSYFSVGADLSAFYSSIRKMELTDGINTTTVDLDKDNYENLSRLDLSFGIRFYIGNK